MIIDMLTEDKKEVYAEGMKDGLRAILDCINHFHDVTGDFPDMNNFTEEILPRLIDNIPEILRMRDKNIKWN